MSHRIVIVGGGAGGLELATRLGRKLGKSGAARIILVDANLTHIWKPLLHEVAAGSLNSSEDELNYVAQAKWNHFEFQLGRMSGLDRTSKSITLAPTLDDDGQVLMPERRITYDSLVIAVGSTTNDFGTPGAAEHCIFLDTRAQAERFHRRMLSHYLRAHASENEYGSKIDIAIVGAGATGVELAAELHHAAKQLVAYGLDRIRPEDMRITLIEAGPRVLPALPERIARPVHQTLEKLGVTVLTGAAVSEVTADGLKTADGNFIPASLKVWAAGIRAPGFLKDLDGLESNRINQLQVRPTLQTTLDDDVFAFGDCAACPQPGTEGRNVPPRAQAAHQQASLLAKSLRLKISAQPLPEYRYRDYGSLISLSSFSAVGNLMGNLTGSVMLEGWLARVFYVSLYRMHQMALYGVPRTLLLMLSDRIGRSTEPRLKLH
ncbi:NAD(P)/FAD-dependent oxidoreductase [Pseudomonas chengduensis]|jgi:NADH dehydrogenase|uniref:FAD-dependent pyridine nucleotide-disulfide oxidoreductase n=1 Tax=Ectopseudomonas oleovorans TaxID=301 RepID=A0A379JTN8_ECTOL|nr:MULTISPECIES: NAD(P)/FAD-dependent oxidoreductase [Pseudomonas]KQO44128.1 NADH dehydrogenase [Pseudomonas sp. Leaf83]MCR1827230.1 NAD(P)/FAD-dependent oxidoreductase [Pseudomonas oleovorans]MDH0568236.1 NAD(P)/FAD-dependent oxidoreductase [Pseudomonas oleovorans]MDH1212072.1 NAD(P)/FAD-dependent oxidoreductase [Pseudomonas chengduensis]MDH1680003.1 NAD(P)/FAD-dependent oxidoreductase [Pseudomonas chengduensis]